MILDIKKIFKKNISKKYPPIARNASENEPQATRLRLWQILSLPATGASQQDIRGIGKVKQCLYPEWPHRQCVGLAFWSGTFATDSVQQILWFAARIAVCNTWGSGGTALCRVGGATSQLDLPSALTPFSVAGCGWLQLGAPHWATSVITASS